MVISISFLKRLEVKCDALLSGRLLEREVRLKAAKILHTCMTRTFCGYKGIISPSL